MTWGASEHFKSAFRRVRSRKYTLNTIYLCTKRTRSCIDQCFIYREEHKWLILSFMFLIEDINYYSRRQRVKWMFVVFIELFNSWVKIKPKQKRDGLSRESVSSMSEWHLTEGLSLWSLLCLCFARTLCTRCAPKLAHTAIIV